MRRDDLPKVTTVDEYLARLDPAQRTALQALRRTIHAAAPRAEEYIAYQLPAFRLDGKPLVGFGATRTHCALYPMSGATVAALGKELAGYETSKGTIRFGPDAPLSASLVKKIVATRVAENAATDKERGARQPAARDRPSRRRSGR